MDPNNVEDLRAAWRALAGARQGDGWQTIPVTVRIRGSLDGSREVIETFDIRLMQAGLLGSTLGRYTRRFLHTSSAILCVQGNFPRLTRANVHSVVKKARYEIDLDLAGAEEVELEQALELMGVT